MASDVVARQIEKKLKVSLFFGGGLCNVKNPGQQEREAKKGHSSARLFSFESDGSISGVFEERWTFLLFFYSWIKIKLQGVDITGISVPKPPQEVIPVTGTKLSAKKRDQTAQKVHSHYHTADRLWACLLCCPRAMLIQAAMLQDFHDVRIGESGFQRPAPDAAPLWAS